MALPAEADSDPEERAVLHTALRAPEGSSILVHGHDVVPDVHAVLGKHTGAAMAGHLEEAHVRPTLEVIVTESPGHLCKAKDKETGLALIKL